MESTATYSPLVAMVVVQLALAALNVVSKLTMASGMSPYVLITYRNLIAAIFLAPFTFFFERKSWSSISRKTLQKIFSWVFYLVGLKYSRPTVASALNNTLPAIWFIIQKKMSRSFASPYTTTTLIASMASVQCGVIGVVAEQQVVVGSMYAGVVASGMVIAVMSWCIQVRGPVFVSMFSPMMLIVVAIIGWAILGEKICAGSVVGALLIVAGLYTVLWGKGRDLAVVHTETSVNAVDDEETMNHAAAAGETSRVPRDKDSCRCMCPYLLF